MFFFFAFGTAPHSPINKTLQSYFLQIGGGKRERSFGQNTVTPFHLPLQQKESSLTKSEVLSHCDEDENTESGQISSVKCQHQQDVQ